MSILFISFHSILFYLFHRCFILHRRYLLYLLIFFSLAYAIYFFSAHSLHCLPITQPSIILLLSHPINSPTSMLFLLYSLFPSLTTHSSSLLSTHLNCVYPGFVSHLLPSLTSLVISLPYVLFSYILSLPFLRYLYHRRFLLYYLNSTFNSYAEYLRILFQKFPNLCYQSHIYPTPVHIVYLYTLLHS